MNPVLSSLTEIREIEAESVRDSAIHRLHPLAKFTVTIFYIALLSSFDRYDLTGMIPYLIYPLLIAGISGVSLLRGIYRLRLVLPLLMAVGIFNPILDRTPVAGAGGLILTAGWLSMITLMLKGILCLLAAYLLTVTTEIYALCRSLRLIHVPEMLVTLFLLTVRYIHVLIREAAVMTDAYMLRAPGQRGIRMDAWGSFLGELLLRSIDRAQEIYAGMQLRGYTGDFPAISLQTFSVKDMIYTAGCITAFLLCRLIPVTEIIGRIVTGI